MNDVVWFVIDMVLAGVNIGVGIKDRNSWGSVLNWLVAFILLSGAAIEFASWLGVGD